MPGSSLIAFVEWRNESRDDFLRSPGSSATPLIIKETCSVFDAIKCQKKLEMYTFEGIVEKHSLKMCKNVN